MRAAWGLETTQDNAPYCWGARAIYRYKSGKADIDLLWDRQEITGESTKEERTKLLSWLNKVGLKRLRKDLEEKGISGDSHEVTAISDDKFILTASPNGSYGYLYLVAEPKCVDTKEGQ